MLKSARRARQRKSAIVDLRTLQACQRRSKNASAMLTRRPRIGGLFVRYQAWVGLSVGATAAERGRRGSNDAMGQLLPTHHTRKSMIVRYSPKVTRFHPHGRVRQARSPL